MFLYFSFLQYHTVQAPINPGEIVTGCAINPFESHEVVFSTDFGNFCAYDMNPNVQPASAFRVLFNTNAAIPATSHSAFPATPLLRDRGPRITTLTTIANPTGKAFLVILARDARDGENAATLQIVYRSLTDRAWRNYAGLRIPGIRGGVTSVRTNIGADGPQFMVYANNEVIRADGMHIYPLPAIGDLLNLRMDQIFMVDQLSNSATDRSSLQNCRGRGMFAQGKCTCFSGFNGPDCGGTSCTAVADCNKRGVCEGPNRCKCNRPFSGVDCGTVSLPSDLMLFPRTGTTAMDVNDAEIYRHPTQSRTDSMYIGGSRSTMDGGIRMWSVQGRELEFASVDQGNAAQTVEILYQVPITDTDQRVDVLVAAVTGVRNALGIWYVFLLLIIQQIPVT
jgi:hypothetical protein